MTISPLFPSIISPSLTTVQRQEEYDGYPSVKTDLVLGNAKRRCSGAGICKISARGQARKKGFCTCAIIPSWLCYVSPSQIDLFFAKKMLTATQYKLLFRNELEAEKQLIQMSCNIRLENDISNQLGFSQQVTLLEGGYPLFSIKDWYYLSFNFDPSLTTSLTTEGE